VPLPGGQPVVPFLPRDPAKLAAHQVDRAMPGQHDEVSAQRPRRRIVTAGMAPQLHEHVLHHVLRGRGVPQNTQRGAIDDRREAVEDLSERVLVPSRQAHREQRVRPPHAWDASATPGREAMTWQRIGHSQADRAHLGKRRHHRASYAGRCHQEYVTAGGIGSALLPIQPVAIYDRNSRNPGTPAADRSSP